jgi:hypothetical protein
LVSITAYNICTHILSAKKNGLR